MSVHGGGLFTRYSNHAGLADRRRDKKRQCASDSRCDQAMYLERYIDSFVFAWSFILPWEQHRTGAVLVKKVLLFQRKIDIFLRNPFHFSRFSIVNRKKERGREKPLFTNFHSIRSSYQRLHTHVETGNFFGNDPRPSSYQTIR